MPYKRPSSVDICTYIWYIFFLWKWGLELFDAVAKSIIQLYRMFWWDFSGLKKSLHQLSLLVFFDSINLQVFYASIVVQDFWTPDMYETPRLQAPFRRDIDEFCKSSVPFTRPNRGVSRIHCINHHWFIGFHAPQGPAYRGPPVCRQSLHRIYGLCVWQPTITHPNKPLWAENHVGEIECVVIIEYNYLVVSFPFPSQIDSLQVRSTFFSWPFQMSHLFLER